MWHGTGWITTASQPKWEGVVGEDPLWKLRQAALLMDLNRSEEATQMVAKMPMENCAKIIAGIGNPFPSCRGCSGHIGFCQAAHQSNFGQTIEVLPAYLPRETINDGNATHGPGCATLGDKIDE